MARRRRDRVRINAEINVVSLIDVMMLLLVIFMITAPMMQGGIDVKLPKAEARPLESKSGMVISVKRNGDIFVDQTKMTYSEFRASIKSLMGPRAKEGVYVMADAGVPYEWVARVAGALVNAGVTSIGLPVEPVRTP